MINTEGSDCDAGTRGSLPWLKKNVFLRKQPLSSPLTILWRSPRLPHTTQILNKVSKIKLEHKIVPNYVFWAPCLDDAGALIITTFKHPVGKPYFPEGTFILMVSIKSIWNDISNPPCNGPNVCVSTQTESAFIWHLPSVPPQYTRHRFWVYCERSSWLFTLEIISKLWSSEF